MTEEEITIRFNLDDDIELRVYNAIKNLPEYYKEPDLSKALIMFINNLVNAIGECEERKTACDNLLLNIVGKQVSGKLTWN